MNDPGNLTLKQIIKYARALGMKVSVVAYNDKDAENERGPVNSEIFEACWQRAGRPTDFFALQQDFSNCFSSIGAALVIANRNFSHTVVADSSAIRDLQRLDPGNLTQFTLLADWRSSVTQQTANTASWNGIDSYA